MATAGGRYLAGAGLSTQLPNLFSSSNTPPSQRPPAVVAINAERKSNSSPLSTTTTTVKVDGAHANTNINGKAVIAKMDEEVNKSWRDYFELAKMFIRSDGGDRPGPPRWFSLLESGTASQFQNCPLLLYLPGLSLLSLLLLFHSNN